MAKRYECLSTGAMDVHKSLALSDFRMQDNDAPERNQYDDIYAHLRIGKKEWRRRDYDFVNSGFIPSMQISKSFEFPQDFPDIIFYIYNLR